MALLIGNLCSLLAMVTDGISSSRKTAKDMLLMQCVSQLLYGICTIVLKGYSGAVQNAVSILRNLIAIRGKESKAVEWGLAALAVILGFCFNNLGVLGWLPIVANLEYTLAVFRFKENERALKIAFLINTALYVVFNVVILNFVGAVSSVAVLIVTAMFLIKSRKRDA